MITTSPLWLECHATSPRICFPVMGCNGQEGESEKHFALMPRTFYVDMDGRSRGQQRSLLRICHITEQKTAGAKR